MVAKINIIAEGDSWFGLPDTPHGSSNILARFDNLATKGSKQYTMKGKLSVSLGQRGPESGQQQSFAHRGHTIEDMLKDIDDIVSRLSNASKIKAPIMALPFSAGGKAFNEQKTIVAKAAEFTHRFLPDRCRAVATNNQAVVSLFISPEGVLFTGGPTGVRT